MSTTSSFRVAESADVSADASIGDGSSIWHLAQVRESAVLGENCVIGRGAYIGTGVRLGDNCKVQNYALVYEPAVLGHGVFIGPAVVLTNDTYPRAVNPDGSLKSAHDWEAVGVTIRDGASVGARGVRRAGYDRCVGDDRRRRRRHEGRTRLRPDGGRSRPPHRLGRKGRSSARARRRRVAVPRDVHKICRG